MSNATLKFQHSMVKDQTTSKEQKVNTKSFDLEQRTYEFARDVRLYLKQIKFNEITESDRIQLQKSSGSVAANYIESVEALSKKDSTHRLRICRKEAKESKLWLQLILDQRPVQAVENLEALRQEAHELC
ncbi:MAG: four helix bundle protein [Verrucomicrobiota bacterium]